MKVSVFDGGRVYAEHSDFGSSARITNKELKIKSIIEIK